MMLSTQRPWLAPMFLLLMQCGDAGGAGNHASLQTRMSTSARPGQSAGAQEKFIAGAATGGGLQSLKYYITSITICEALETNGSAFNNPTGCIELYRRDIGALTYQLNGDWTPLGDIALATTDGYIDLLSESSRSQLSGSTVLRNEHVRSYNYGLINWALPVKVKAELSMNDGSKLYTHDGVSTAETGGVDNYRSYFTRTSVPLTQAPAEEAVVLLPNGGNWFKFQSPFVISQDDIEQQREFVLDLVFDPSGIVKGFTAGQGQGQISERAPDGRHLNDITVPMLDLAPVPHRASEQVMRETYQGPIELNGNAFDMRLELYYVEGDPSGTVYGVDLKSLVNARSTTVPPDLSKISYLDRAADGTLTFASYAHTPILTGLRRVAGNSGSTRIGVTCGMHGAAAVNGAAALITDRCPTPVLDIALQLTSREPVTGSIATAVGGGFEDGGMPIVVGGLDAGIP